VSKATEDKGVAFKLCHPADGGLVSQRLFCKECGVQLERGELAKGYLRDDGEVIVLTDEDLADLPLATSKTIDVLHFCPEAQIGPELADALYYLSPLPGGERAYGLVLEALAKSRKVAVAKVALRAGREHLAVVRPYMIAGPDSVTGVLSMSLLRWPDEIRRPPVDADLPKSRRQELVMASNLIDTMTADFDPDAHRDLYREAVIAVVEAKSAGTPVVHSERQPAAAETSLAEALQASLDAAARPAKPAPRKRPARKQAAS
jgi:DNA end-binding protein Ku